MIKRINTIWIILFFVAVFFIPLSIFAEDNAQSLLRQYISDLQKNTTDNVLREKIISHVQTMSPAPVVPEEARKYVNRGMAAFDDAKSEKDYKDSSDEFQKAVNIAPWLGAGYRGLAVTQDKSGEYSSALQNLNLFLLTNPSAEDAEKARTLRDKIEYRKEKAEKDKGQAARKAVEDARAKQEAAEAKRASEQEEFLRKIEGAKYIYSFWDSDSRSTINWFVDIRGRKLVLTSGNGFEWCRVDILGREAVWQMNNYERVVFTVGEETITKTSSNGINVFRRVR